MDSTTSQQVATTDSNVTDKPSRLADISPEELNTPVDGDNIADDIASDAALAEFIQDIENNTVIAEPKKMPSVADLYMMHVGASSQIKYRDEIDDYNDLCGSPSDETPCAFGKLGREGPSVYNVQTTYSSYQPKTSGYADYIDTTYAKWQRKSSNKPKISHKVASFLDEPIDTNVGEILEDAIDAVGDRVDAIYDCVKSVDQQVNDLYEKSLGVGDAIEDLQEASRSQTLRGVEIEKRLQTLEITQSQTAAAVTDIARTLADLVKTIDAIKKDTDTIRRRL